MQFGVGRTEQPSFMVSHKEYNDTHLGLPNPSLEMAVASCSCLLESSDSPKYHYSEPSISYQRYGNRQLFPGSCALHSRYACLIPSHKRTAFSKTSYLRSKLGEDSPSRSWLPSQSFSEEPHPMLMEGKSSHHTRWRGQRSTPFGFRTLGAYQRRWTRGPCLNRH